MKTSKLKSIFFFAFFLIFALSFITISNYAQKSLIANGSNSITEVKSLSDLKKELQKNIQNVRAEEKACVRKCGKDKKCAQICRGTANKKLGELRKKFNSDAAAIRRR